MGFLDGFWMSALEERLTEVILGKPCLNWVEDQSWKRGHRGKMLSEDNV